MHTSKILRATLAAVAILGVAILSGCAGTQFTVTYVVTGEEGVNAVVEYSAVSGDAGTTEKAGVKLPWEMTYEFSGGNPMSNTVTLKAETFDGDLTCDVLINGVSVGSDSDIGECSIIQGNVGRDAADTEVAPRP